MANCRILFFYLKSHDHMITIQMTVVLFSFFLSFFMLSVPRRRWKKQSICPINWIMFICSWDWIKLSEIHNLHPWSRVRFIGHLFVFYTMAQIVFELSNFSRLNRPFVCIWFFHCHYQFVSPSVQWLIDSRAMLTISLSLFQFSHSKSQHQPMSVFNSFEN